MKSLTLKLTILLTAAFGISVGLIRTQTANTIDPRDSLRPADCAAPCMMGIRPGVTTRDEARTIIENHAWVDFVTRDGETSIKWAWSGLQPPVIDPFHEGLVRWNRDGVVTMVEVDTWMQLGRALILDEPDALNATAYNRAVTVSYVVPPALVYLQMSCDVGLVGQTRQALDLPVTYSVRSADWFASRVLPANSAVTIHDLNTLNTARCPS